MLVKVSVCVAHRYDVCKRRQFYDPYHGSSASRKFSDPLMTPDNSEINTPQFVRCTIIRLKARTRVSCRSGQKTVCLVAH